MEAGKQLINTALLGTEKSLGGMDVLPVSEAFAPLMQKIQSRDTDAETKLLEAAAALYLYRRCGVRPLSEEVKATAAQEETQPYCSESATKALKEILKTGSTGMLLFWLDKCHSNAAIFQPELLDVMLESAAQNGELRSLTIACAGKRGEWLCSLNPEWDFAEETTDEELWQTGTTAQRATFLKAIRTADPAKARNLLEAVWGEEKADVREGFLRTFKHNLTAEDLPFLDTISTDKSKRVKALVFELRMLIPESSAVKAFEEQLRGAVAIQTTKKLLGLISKTELVITTAIGDKPVPDAIGRNLKGLSALENGVFEMVQATRFVPPSFWESHLNTTPEQILELFENVPYSKHYLNAIRDAVIRFGDKRWAPLFLDKTGDPDMGLVPLLPADDANTYLLRSAKVDPDAVLDYYAKSRMEWPAEAAPSLLVYLVANPYEYNRKFFNSHAYQIPLSVLPLLTSFSPKSRPDDTATSAQYAAQMWDTTREHLTELLTLKEKTEKAFLND